MGRTPHDIPQPQAPELSWTIVARRRSGRLELVRVPANPDVRTAAAERVLRVVTEPGARPEGEGTGGLISDRSGQTALRAFRAAVRAAKAR